MPGRRRSAIHASYFPHMHKPDANTEFLLASETFLREHFDRICEACERLTPEQLWWRPNEASNSVANLLMHLEGNVRQWIVSNCGGLPDKRQRSREFAAREGASREELLDALGQTVLEACHVLAKFDPARMTEKRTVQGYEYTLLKAIYHSVEHFSYHTGQIVMRAKAISGDGFSWYKHLDGT
ncbi:MAG: DUF1572 family protein [bacterium]|nr:DUF1572 family protein [bacterium]